jgi:glycosyltransferase involved in cell wall biosynthesis
MKLSIVIPVYNEVSSLETMIAKVRAATPGMNREILLVDDGSTDGTREIIERLRNAPDVRVQFHDRNRGKGAALRTGFGMVQGDLVVVQDADLEYDPVDYPKLLAPLLDGRADVVFGSRFSGETHRVLFFWHYVGNKLLTTLSNMFTNLNLTDMETCYKAFRAPILKDIRFRADRFGFEPEFTAKVAKRGYRIYETSISYSGRDYAEGKKITWWDGVKALGAIVWFRFFD